MHYAGKYLIFGLVFTLLALTVPAYKNIIFSTKFVDEEYNFAIGKYLTRGEILYRDIITNHQPITHLLSGFLQYKQKPGTTKELISTQRTAIANWSAIWSIILVFYFGLAGLIFSFIFELTRNHLYGNLFLAETISAYPLAFLIGLALFRKEPLKAAELFLSGALLAFLALILGPIWPAIIFLAFIFLVKQFKDSNFKKSLALGLLGFLLIFLLVLPFVNVPGYFRYYFLGNLENTIPRTIEYWIPVLTKSFISPALSFMIKEPNDNLRLIQALSVILLLSLTFKKKFGFAAAIFVVLGLLNLRYANPGEGYSKGFHLLPWYSALVFITSFLFVQQLRSKSPYIIKGISIGTLIIAIFFSLKSARLTLFVEKDTKRDYEVFYSTHTKIGESIKGFKKPGDTLFVFPDAWLVYWQSDADHLPKLFGYYTWMSGIPELKRAVNQAFTKFPPTFFYCEGCQHTDLNQYLYKYKEAKGYENKQNLLVLP